MPACTSVTVEGTADPGNGDEPDEPDSTVSQKMALIALAGVALWAFIERE